MAISRNAGGPTNGLSPGEYVVTVSRVELKESAKKDPMLVVHFKTKDDRRIAAYFVKKYPHMLASLKTLMACCGVTATDDLMGKECGIAVEAGRNKDNGQAFMHIVGYGKASEVTGSFATSDADDGVPF